MMAIDGRIKAMEVKNKDLVLTLEPRVGSDGSVSIAGQDQLTIQDFKFTPEVGDEIWGGADFVHIVRQNGRPELIYRRISYTRMLEDHDYAMRSKGSPRFA